MSLAWAVGTTAYFINHPALVCARRTARVFLRLAVDADMKRHISCELSCWRLLIVVPTVAGTAGDQASVPIGTFQCGKSIGLRSRGSTINDSFAEQADVIQLSRTENLIFKSLRRISGYDT